MFYKDLDKMEIEKVYNSSICTYSYKGFLFDVVSIFDDENDRRFESWIYHKDYGVKDLMFGVSQNDCSFQDFIIMIYDNIDDYIKGYIDDYFDR